MNLDIRTPMGWMFLIIGLIIAIYGAATSGSPMYAKHSLGVNVNLWWGLAMALFGAVMLGLAWLAAKAKTPTGDTPPASSEQRKH